MTIQLRPEQERRIQELIEAGRFDTPNAVVNQAIEALAANADSSMPALHRRQLLEFLEQSGSGWNWDLHPELHRGAAEWVESVRRTDEQIDTVPARS